MELLVVVLIGKSLLSLIDSLFLMGISSLYTWTVLFPGAFTKISTLKSFFLFFSLDILFSKAFEDFDSISFSLSFSFSFSFSLESSFTLSFSFSFIFVLLTLILFGFLSFSFSCFSLALFSSFFCLFLSLLSLLSLLFGLAITPNFLLLVILLLYPFLLNSSIDFAFKEDLLLIGLCSNTISSKLLLILPLMGISSKYLLVLVLWIGMSSKF